MQRALESQAALRLVAGAAVEDGLDVLARSSGSMESRRLTLLDTVPALIGYYSEGSSALAADFYEEERFDAGVRSRYTAQLVIVDRTVKIRRAIAWAAQPLADGAEDVTAGRLAEVIQLESARPYRDTVTHNTRADSEAMGWSRVASGSACKMCRALAAKGSVYKKDTVHFATHENCSCTARPRFAVGEYGPEASVLQYQLNGSRTRTPEQRSRLRDWLNHEFPDSPG